MNKTRAAVPDIVAGLVLIVLAWYVMAASSGFRGEGGLLPTILAYLIGSGGLVLIALSAARLLWAAGAGPAAGAGKGGRPPTAALLFPAAVLGATVAYAYLIPRLGFYLASALYIPGILALLGIRRPLVHVATLLFFLALLYLVFERAFMIPLPRARWL
jgi:hypothetical protein